MAFNTTEGRVEYTASVGQSIFTFLFKIYTNTDLKVYQTPQGSEANDTNDLLTLGTHYTVTVDGDNGGSITLLTPTASADSITIVRSLSVGRDFDYQTNGDLLADTLDDDQNYQTYLIADQQAKESRSLTIPDSVQGLDTELPAPEALKLMRWNSSASALENVVIGDDDIYINIRNEDNMTDLLSVNVLTYETINVRGYHTKNDGGGGLFNYDSTIDKSTANGGTILDPSQTLANQGSGSGLGCWVRQYSGTINVKWFGAIDDKSTDNTDIVRDTINAGYVEGGKEIYIPDGVKWLQNSLLTWLTKTPISTADAGKTITNLDLNGINVVGAFIWNLTDNSYGTIVSQTATSITVNALYLGTRDYFVSSDEINISLLKVGVNIVDESRYSEHNNKFTGQRKKWVNMDLPHTGSANEEWTWGQYHPAHIVANNNPSDMEKRASNLWRIYNKNNKIQSYLQFGINPLNNTDATTNPGDASDIILTGGHNQGVDTQDVQLSQQLLGFKFSDDMVGMYMGIGRRAYEGISVYQQQKRNIPNIWQFDAKGTQNTKFQFMNDAVIQDEWVIQGVSAGTRGIRKFVVNNTSNYNPGALGFSGSISTNTGAVGAVNFYIPDVVTVQEIGLTYTLVVTEAQALQFVPIGSSQIRGTTAINKAVSSATIGDSITLVSTEIGIYDVVSEKGTWTYS